MRSWLKQLSGLRGPQKGQTTAEYAIIVALVAVSSIAIILIFGNQIRELFFAESSKLATGNDTTVKDVTTGNDSKTAGSIKEF